MKCPRCNEHLPEMDRPEDHILESQRYYFDCDNCGSDLVAEWCVEESVILSVDTHEPDMIAAFADARDKHAGQRPASDLTGRAAPLIELIIEELRRAEKQHPHWPDDPIHAAAIVGEESGELTQACIDYYYSNSDGKAAVDEAVQTGAMAIRFLLHVGKYQRKI